MVGNVYFYQAWYKMFTFTKLGTKYLLLPSMVEMFAFTMLGTKCLLLPSLVGNVCFYHVSL
jgi:hypothetical protein